MKVKRTLCCPHFRLCAR